MTDLRVIAFLNLVGPLLLFAYLLLRNLKSKSFPILVGSFIVSDLLGLLTISWISLTRTSFATAIVLGLLLQVLVFYFLVTKIPSANYEKESLFAIAQKKISTTEKVTFILAFLTIATNVVFSLKHGDYSWDGNSQHGIISRAFVQNGGVLVDNLVSPFQGYPSTVELKGSILSLVFDNYLVSAFAQMSFVLLFILLVISIAFANLDDRARGIVIPGILGSGTLVFAGGFNYSDIAQGLYWLLLIYSLILFLNDKVFISIVFFAASIAGIEATKFAGLYALIVFLLFFPALPALLSKFNLLSFTRQLNRQFLFKFYVGSFIGLILGSVWFVRNFMSFNNIAFPGPSPFSFMTDGPLSSDYLNGMLNASRSLEIQGAPNEYVLWWNFIGSFFVGLNILIKDFVYLIRGRLSEINTMLPEIVGHDARLAGLGLSLQLLFVGILVMKLCSSKRVLTSRKIRFSTVIILVCLAGIAFTPGNSAMRYFVGTAAGLVLLVAASDKFLERIPASVSRVVVLFSVFSLLLNLAVSGYKLYDLRNVIDQTSSHSMIPSNWFGWETPPVYTQECFNTAVVGFASSFPTILWGNNPCSSVTRFRDGQEFIESENKLQFNRLALTLPNPQSSDSPQLPKFCLDFTPSGGVSNVVSGTNESRLAFYYPDSLNFKSFELTCISKVSRAQW